MIMQIDIWTGNQL